jgi:hypothetical protein
MKARSLKAMRPERLAMPLSNPIQGEELVEAVASEAANDVASRIIAGREFAPSFGEMDGETQEYWRSIARAVIPIVLEQAAGVAEGMMSLYPHKSRASDATSDFDKGAQQALYLSAQAIRSLASQGREG